jgi:TetR/AcrR family transcriptional repressor of nem operon
MEDGMPRTFNEEKHTERRKEILDAALKLVYTKGYEQMTIQDILDSLQISKGAFYYYFDSKGAVLEALVERMVLDEAVPLLTPIVQNPNLSAVEKLERYFDSAARWKTTQKTFLLELMRVWLADENAIVRQKMMGLSVKWVTPLLTDIIRQGIEEGVFTNPYPDQISNVIIYIMLGLSDQIIEMMISPEANKDSVYLEREINAYIGALTDAMERILGAQKGSLKLIDPELLKVWFV